MRTYFNYLWCLVAALVLGEQHIITSSTYIHRQISRRAIPETETNNTSGKLASSVTTDNSRSPLPHVYRQFLRTRDFRSGRPHCLHYTDVRGGNGVPPRGGTPFKFILAHVPSLPVSGRHARGPEKDGPAESVCLPGQIIVECCVPLFKVER